MPLDLCDLALEEEPTGQVELLHFVIHCRVLVRGDEGQEVLANRLENGMLSQQIHIIPSP